MTTNRDDQEHSPDSSEEQDFTVEQPGGSNPADHTQTSHHEVGLQVGDHIGPYQLLEEIGVGGMGVVYVAAQKTPIKRQVAIKVIKPGTDSREVISRFEAERQALALMDHRNIARVLDAGTTPRGLPYFVMDLVRGIPITQYCDDGKLTSRERLDLFISVCQAIQHAHQKGIIHRDIKPQNVLVELSDGHPQVKVIDFGVAKALHRSLTDKTIYTRFTQIIGTPLYMSPEQAERSGIDVDTRTDIYSLGVLLYELLTGSTPIEHSRLIQAGIDEICRIIREEEPPKPSTKISSLGDDASEVSLNRKSSPVDLQRQLSGDLDWIALKALSKDREHRYESASAFADDVQRYLSNEPVTATPPSRWYKTKKFVRRNQQAVVLGGLMILLLAAGIAGTSWGYFQARAAADLASKNEERALEQSELATDTLTTVVREIQKALQYVDEAHESRRIILQESIRALDALDESQKVLGGRYSRNLIMAHLNLGDVYMRYGTAEGLDGRDEAMKHFERCLELSNEWVDSAPGDEAAIQRLGFAHERIGDALLRQGAVQEARPYLLEALAISHRLIDEFPDSPSHYRSPMHLNTLLGVCAIREFDIAEAEKRWRLSRAAIDRCIEIGGNSLMEGDVDFIPELERRIAVMSTLPKMREDISAVNGLSSQHQPRALYDLAAWLAHDGEYTQASEVLSQLLDRDDLVGGDYYSAACGYGRCIKAIERERGSEELSSELRETITHHQEQCVAALRECQKTGYVDGSAMYQHLLTDTDLDPVRSNSQFVRFMDDLKSRL